ncbi:hypothetical protein FOA52_009077 [Chlamydomonas sp. UWO 241]|nr:hypothetical protein FOA52_009077 [Chlamydomonas sp. UWO 241]
MRAWSGRIPGSNFSLPWMPARRRIWSRLLEPSSNSGTSVSRVQQLALDRSSQAPVATRRVLHAEGVGAARLQHFSFPKGLTFGIELEMALSSSISDSQVADMLTEAGLHGWRTKRDDSTICCPTWPEECRTVELVSPVLKGIDGARDLYTAMDAMKSLGPRVNKSTGMHVHIRNLEGGWRLDHLKRVASNFVVLESGFDLLVPPSRRASKNMYCTSIVGQGGVGGTLKRIQRAYDYDDLVAAINPDCRCKLNLHALALHNTIEFRHPAGTQNAAKAAGYVLMYLALVQQSRKHRFFPQGPKETVELYSFEQLLAFFSAQPVLLHWMPRRRDELLCL